MRILVRANDVPVARLGFFVPLFSLAFHSVTCCVVGFSPCSRPAHTTFHGAHSAYALCLHTAAAHVLPQGAHEHCMHVHVRAPAQLVHTHPSGWAVLCALVRSPQARRPWPAPWRHARAALLAAAAVALHSAAAARAAKSPCKIEDTRADSAKKCYQWSISSRSYYHASTTDRGPGFLGYCDQSNEAKLVCDGGSLKKAGNAMLKKIPDLAFARKGVETATHKGVKVRHSPQRLDFSNNEITKIGKDDFIGLCQTRVLYVCAGAAVVARVLVHAGMRATPNLGRLAGRPACTCTHPGKWRTGA